MEKEVGSMNIDDILKKIEQDYSELVKIDDRILELSTEINNISISIEKEVIYKTDEKGKKKYTNKEQRDIAIYEEKTNNKKYNELSKEITELRSKKSYILNEIKLLKMQFEYALELLKLKNNDKQNI